MKPLTTIRLNNNDSCDIYDMLAFHYMKAIFNYNMAVSNDPSIVEIGLQPFILQQILLINKTKPTINYIINLHILDYNSINEVMEVIFKKIM